MASPIPHISLALCIVWTIFGSAETDQKPDNYPWISTLDSGDWEEKLWGDRQVRENGSRLMKLGKGLHLLDHEITPDNGVLIAIHGFAARGFEWVYPLLTMDNAELDTYFFRWGWARRTERAEALFLSELTELREQRGKSFTNARIVAHSCGGVVAISVVENLPEEIEFDIHVVASPLGGLGAFTVCDPDLPKKLPDNVTITQWKTQQHLDSVFLYFPGDPQDTGLDFISEVDLPELYRGKRLGHVRSLSWVADQVADATDEIEASNGPGLDSSRE